MYYFCYKGRAACTRPIPAHEQDHASQKVGQTSFNLTSALGGVKRQFVCPRSLDPIYIVFYNIKGVKAFWTDSIIPPLSPYPGAFIY